MEKIVEILKKNNNFVIAGHTSPDGDAIGSCFGLGLALSKLGKNVQVVLDKFSDKYAVIPGKHLLSPVNQVNKYDVFVAVDCASDDRLGNTKKLFSKAPVTVCIDHHETNMGFAEHNFIETEASSTSELVYRIVKQIVEIDINIGSALYAGMVSDTGGFRFNATAKSTMETAAKLMDIGIPFTDIYNELMHKHSFVAGKALGLAIDNSVMAENGLAIYTCIKESEMDLIGAEPSDLDGVVEYLMGTRGVLVAALLHERVKTNIVKISLRSGGYNVSSIATVLGGGGHKMAAGADFKGTMDEALEKTLCLIRKDLIMYDQTRCN